MIDCNCVRWAPHWCMDEHGPCHVSDGLDGLLGDCILMSSANSTEGDLLFLWSKISHERGGGESVIVRVEILNLNTTFSSLALKLEHNGKAWAVLMESDAERDSWWCRKIFLLAWSRKMLPAFNVFLLGGSSLWSCRFFPGTADW